MLPLEAAADIAAAAGLSMGACGSISDGSIWTLGSVGPAGCDSWRTSGSRGRAATGGAVGARLPGDGDGRFGAVCSAAATIFARSSPIGVTRAGGVQPLGDPESTSIVQSPVGRLDGVVFATRGSIFGPVSLGVIVQSPLGVASSTATGSGVGARAS